MCTNSKRQNVISSSIEDYPIENRQLRWFLRAAVGVLIWGLFIRIPGLFHDFWFDEVWSYYLVQKANTIADIFTSLNHDNNHYLNSLGIFILGPEQEVFVYRMPSLLAGVAGLLGVAWHFWSVRTRSAFIFLVLYATSYPLVHYCSEARGYALAYSIATILWLHAGRRPLPRTTWARAIYSVLLILGLLAHLTFAYFAVAISLLLLVRELKTLREQSQLANYFRGMRHVVLLHLPPFFVGAALYWFDVRFLEVGSATQAHMVPATAMSIASMLGFIMVPPATYLAAMGMIALVLYESCVLLRKKEYEEFVFLTALFLVATGVTLWRQSGFIYPRYLLILTPYFLWVLARFCGRMLSASKVCQVATIVVLTACFVGGVFQSSMFALVGRGKYKKALSFMAERSRQQIVTVSSDFDFRQEMLVRFHSRNIATTKAFQYVPNAQIADALPLWVVAHRPTGYETLKIRNRPEEYRLVKTFPSYGLSGWPWYVYQKHLGDSP